MVKNGLFCESPKTLEGKLVDFVFVYPYSGGSGLVKLSNQYNKRQKASPSPNL